MTMPRYAVLVARAKAAALRTVRSLAIPAEDAAGLRRADPHASDVVGHRAMRFERRGLLLHRRERAVGEREGRRALARAARRVRLGERRRVAHDVVAGALRRAREELAALGRDRRHFTF